MSRSHRLVLLLLVCGVAGFLLIGSTAASLTGPRVPVALEVDGKVSFDRDQVRVAFIATPEEAARIAFQLGFALPGSCEYRQLENAGSKEGRVRFTDRLPDAKPAAGRVLYTALPKATDAAAQVTPRTGSECPRPAGAVVDREAPLDPTTRVGAPQSRFLEAGIPERLEAVLHLDTEIPWDTRTEGRWFVRVWVDDGPYVVLLGLGESYEPPPTGSAHDAASLVLFHNVSAALWVMAPGHSLAPTMKGHHRDKGESPLAWPLVWLFTRLRRSDLLDHKTRRLVYDAIEADPGIRFGALRDQTGLALGVLTHHLRILEEHDLVVSDRRGRHRYLYPKQGARERSSRLSERPEAILALLAAGPLSQAELAGRLGISQQAVSYHLRRLTDADLIVRERSGSGVWVYRPARTH